MREEQRRGRRQRWKRRKEKLVMNIVMLIKKGELNKRRSMYR